MQKNVVSKNGAVLTIRFGVFWGDVLPDRSKYRLELGVEEKPEVRSMSRSQSCEDR